MSADPTTARASMIRNLEENSGASLAQWIERARAAGSSQHSAIVAHLKSAHQLGHGYANLVAHQLKEVAAGGPVGDDALLAAQYSGSRAPTRPILDALVAAVRALDPQAGIAVKKTCVSLRRAKQFALVQPGTATRVDLGLVLKGTPAAGRLEAAGSFNAMVSHRVRLSSPGDVDAEVTAWLRTAWEQAR